MNEEFTKNKHQHNDVYANQNIDQPINQCFEIRVISLNNQIERRSDFSSFLDKTFVNWKFFDAIPGSPELLKHPLYNSRKRKISLGYDLRQNEIACFLSHRELWKECANSNLNFLIFEDDAILLNEKIEILNFIKIINNLTNKKENFIRIGNGGLNEEYIIKSKITEELSLVRFKKDPSCAFCYLLSPDVAKKLLYNSISFYTPVDDFMWRGWEHKCLLLDIVPNIISPSPIQSTIGNRTKPKLKFTNKIIREILRSIEAIQRKIYENNQFK